jgi:4'-phosphopantetheinyl transferase EntD
MNGEALCRTLQELVPTGVCVAAGTVLTTPLSVRERKSLGNVDAERIREFESGRAYAKCALAMLGFDNVDLPIGPGRSPVWPTGVIGSITHARCRNQDLYAAAVVTRADVALALGVDLEMDDGLHPTIWPYVLTQRELERILAFPVAARRKEATYIWCAKEATLKTIGYPLEFSGIEVDRDATSGHFVAGFSNDTRQRHRTSVWGRTACLERLLIATVVVPKLPSQKF